VKHPSAEPTCRAPTRQLTNDNCQILFCWVSLPIAPAGPRRRGFRLPANRVRPEISSVSESVSESQSLSGSKSFAIPNPIPRMVRGRQQACHNFRGVTSACCDRFTRSLAVTALGIVGSSLSAYLGFQASLSSLGNVTLQVPESIPSTRLKPLSSRVPSSIVVPSGRVIR